MTTPRRRPRPTTLAITALAVLVVASCADSEFGQSTNTVGAVSALRPSSLECAA